MKTGLRLGARLYRRHWGRMLFFSACVCAGTALLFGIENLLVAVQRSVAARAREILGADVEVSSNRPFDAKARRAFAALAAEGVRGLETVQFASMLRSERAGTVPFLVSVKAVPEGWPLYGDLESEPADARTRLSSGRTCLIEAAAALQHGLKAGDQVALGQTTLTVAGLLRKEPGRAFAAFSLGPCVLIPRRTVEETGLVRLGSRIWYSRLLAVPHAADPSEAARTLKARLERELDDPYLWISAFGDADPTVREALQRAGVFFVLVSLVALLLAALGMAAGYTIFLNEQIETVGLLRALGIGPGEIARLYHGLSLAVGLQGGLLGAAAGWGLSAGAIGLLARLLGLQFPIEPAVSLPALAESLGLACLLAVGVTWGKVRALARVSPLDILRERSERLPVTPWATAATAAAALGLVFAYAYVKLSSLEIARSFALALVGSGLGIGLLILAALPLFGAAASALPAVPFALRHGLLQLTRQKARTWVFLFTLASGFTLLGALGLVHHGLDREILLGKAEDAPDLFLVDVQRSQGPGVAALAGRHARGVTAFAPLVRARLVQVNEVPVQRRGLSGMSLEQRTRERHLTREYNLTYASTLNPSEKIVAGRFWAPGEAGAQASLEEGFARRSGLKLGDVLRFDIQGREVEAPVTSLRAVDWMSMRPNFFAVLSPGLLEKAPQTFIASLRIRDEAATAAFTRKLVARFPNVSVINVTRFLDTVQGVLGALEKALAVVAAFCVGVGLLVLAGTLSLGHRERRDQAALFRAVGAPRRLLLLMDAVEFLAIGALTFAISWLAAWGLGRVVSWKMDVAFAFDAPTLLATLGAALLLPLAVGLAVNAPAYRLPVMEILRRES